VSKLLIEFGEGRPVTVTQPGQVPQGSLVEPLSERELDVLRLLPTSLSTTGIAEGLYISKNTVRSHVAHIYGKLGVHSRLEAVQRAQELGLLWPTFSRQMASACPRRSARGPVSRATHLPDKPPNHPPG
jgi:DNA-binding CsgD family transcriptional regulator